MSKPIIAIVGRPNVGKSTLFNALAGSRISIVEDTPGVTRDRIYADVTWLNYQFTLIDTGGIEPDSGDLLLSHMRGQAEIAMETADVIIFLTDVRQGLVDADYQVADMLRRSGKPIVLAVNKVDNYEKFVLDTYEFYNLGLGTPFPVSANSKIGFGDLLDEVLVHCNPQDADEKEDEIGQIPLLEVAQEVKKEKIESKQSFTEPPPRYTEASLVKALEEKDIGRPSTYSPTITTILARRYIEKIQKLLYDYS